MALMDASALANPLVIGIESLREIIVGDNFVWQGTTPACDDCTACS
jgi:hypothetical protein